MSLRIWNACFAATLFPSLAMLALVVSATLLSIAYNDARNPRPRED